MKGARFGDGNGVGFAIDRCRRREDDVLDAVVARDVEKDEGASYVVPIVFERLFRAFPDGFEASEVDDRIDVVTGEHFFERSPIEDGCLDECKALIVRSR